jgi:hypothetical protein
MSYERKAGTDIPAQAPPGFPGFLEKKFSKRKEDNSNLARSTRISYWRT